MAYEHIIVETRGPVGLIRLNRPKAMNALCADLVREIAAAVDAYEADDAIGALVVTGSEKAFCAGADIKEMQSRSYMDVYKADFITARWEHITRIRKPVVAAVAGYALGGGCELAMTCDIIVAGESARFGQPEVKIGIIPGGGGTQRLPRLVGRGRALEIILSGDDIDAATAEQWGYVNRTLPEGELRPFVDALATRIAGLSAASIALAKQAVDAAADDPVPGLLREGQLFRQSLRDPAAGERMTAFMAAGGQTRDVERDGFPGGF
jgi:enoyl-CoA hydratase